jgi:8-amino-7-oxononanoate synthase/dethiobiotin synthase
MTLDWIAGELRALEQRDLRRHPWTLQSAQEAEVSIDGAPMILLCSNNYLGLAADPRVKRAAADAAMRWGAGSGASRLVSGTTSLHRELEGELARFKGTGDAMLFSSGYLANAGTLDAIAGDGDAVFSDALNHASIIDGCRASGARTVVYHHADPGHLDAMLREVPARRRLVVTDTIFSMDGDAAPLAELHAVCVRHGAMLMVDEAHATGVVGATGAGLVEDVGLTGRVDVVMGTLSKALGSSGGYVCGSHDLVEWLRNRARTHVFDTASSPPSVAGAREALRIVGAEPWRRRRVRELARVLAAGLEALGYETREPAAAVVPVMIGDAAEALELSAKLFDLGVFCPAIRPPSVPDGTARLRACVMATHTDAHVDRVLEAFARATHRTRRADTAPSLSADIDARIAAARGVFVTGTDTGVGKTVVTAALARTFEGRGLRVGIMKPAQTGTRDGVDDAAYAAELSGCARSAVTYALAEPLAPAVAARLEGGQLDLDAITQAFADMSSDVDLVVVEGAGGLLVPFTDDCSMADLARALGLPAVVVARPALGTINHTALTVEAARSRGVDVIGVILSAFPDPPGLAEATNPAEIERCAHAPLVGVVPVIDSLDTESRTFPPRFDPAPWLAPCLGGTFDREGFLYTIDQRRCDAARR